MNRRTFLKGLAGTLALAGLPVDTIEALITNPRPQTLFFFYSNPSPMASTSIDHNWHHIAVTTGDKLRTFLDGCEIPESEFPFVVETGEHGMWLKNKSRDFTLSWSTDKDTGTVTDFKVNEGKCSPFDLGCLSIIDTELTEAQIATLYKDIAPKKITSWLHVGEGALQLGG